MLRLSQHPFAVEAFFESSVVLCYAVPKEKLAGLIPECLELDTLDDKWAFLAAAFVKTRALRPKGFPAFMGNDFFLAGYRIFVRYRTNAGKSLRGLYILKSETDKAKMKFFGNIFTRYSYTSTDIDFRRDGNSIQIRSEKSALDIDVSAGGTDIALPAESPFKDWKEARRFAGPLPFTFTYDAAKKEVLIIEGVRQNWIPQPLEVKREHVGFIEKKALDGLVLANAFLVQNIPYWWKKGRVEKWKA